MRKNIFFILIAIIAIVLVVILARRGKEEQQLTNNLYTDWNAYEDESFGLYYPKDFTPLSNYRYEALGPGKEIAGVAFTVPAVLAEKTNLSSDSKISVETIPGKDVCTLADFLSAPAAQRTITQDGSTITVAEQVEAAAGNRYHEVLYLYPNCQAVRYFIHSTALQNYDPGTVQAFDQTALLNAFDLIRASVVWHE